MEYEEWQAWPSFYPREAATWTSLAPYSAALGAGGSASRQERGRERVQEAAKRWGSDRRGESNGGKPLQGRDDRFSGWHGPTASLLLGSPPASPLAQLFSHAHEQQLPTWRGRAEGGGGRAICEDNHGTEVSSAPDSADPTSCLPGAASMNSLRCLAPASPCPCAPPSERTRRREEAGSLPRCPGPRRLHLAPRKGQMCGTHHRTPLTHFPGPTSGQVPAPGASRPARGPTANCDRL